MGKLTDEQKRNAREFFRQNELAPPYDRELEELATILAPASHVAETAALREALDIAHEALLQASGMNELVAQEWMRKATSALAGWP